MKWGLWSTTAGNNNNAPPDGWPEGQAPSTVNDCAREMMASIRTAVNDLQFVDQGHSPTYVDSTHFTIPGNVTTYYDVGRRVKAYVGAGTAYGTVVSASFTANTGVQLRMDSTVLDGSISAVGVGIISTMNYALPDQIMAQDNLVINGQLDFWQRGNTFTASGSGAAAQVYTADRFKISMNAAASIAMFRSERSANASNVPTLAQCGTLLNSSLGISVSATHAMSGAERCILKYTMEGYDFRQIAQSPFTVSFWMQSNQTGTYCLSVRNSGNDQAYVSECTLSTASTWVKKTITVPPSPAAGTWDYSNGPGLKIALALASGSGNQGGAGNWTATSIICTSNQTNLLASAGNIMKIAGFKVEPGVAATPLKPVIWADEKRRCQRYHQVTLTIFEGYGVSNNSLLVPGTFFGNMRSSNSISTSITLANPSGITGVTVFSINSAGLALNYAVGNTTGLVRGDVTTTLDAEF